MIVIKNHKQQAVNDLLITIDNLYHFVQDTDLQPNTEEWMAFKTYCESSHDFILLRDIEKDLMVYCNQAAAFFFNLNTANVEKFGYAFFKHRLHPDFIHINPISSSYFINTDNYNSVYEYMYYLDTNSGWKWIHSCSRIITFNSNGSPRYIAFVMQDIEHKLKSKQQDEQSVVKFIDQHKLLKERYDMLSKREKQILEYVSNEFTTQEIADKLLISKSTVDAHRKSMLKKLNVKNALGLTKYAIVFGENV